jgi:DNA-binding MarR family transcriptional regulator
MSSEVSGRENTQQNDFPSTAPEMYRLFNNTSYVVSRAREIELNNFGLTLEQSMLLHTLITMGGSATLDEISAFTMRQYHSVSTLVKRMTKSGLVKKIKYSDEKKFQVAITEKGSHIFLQTTCNSLTMIFSALSPEDQQALTKCLKLLMSKARSLLGLDYINPFLP